MSMVAILDRLHASVQTLQERPGVADRMGAGVGAEVAETLRLEGPEAARFHVERLANEGVLDPIERLSALLGIAASPAEKDYAEASRMASLIEYVALEAGGPDTRLRLAAADRDRGIIAFLMGRFDVSLDWFTRAYERERSPRNVANILSALVANGERTAAHELMGSILMNFPAGFVEELEGCVAAERNLETLRRR